MKTKTTLIVLLSATLAAGTMLAQETSVEKTAENVTMREGTFWPNHTVEGKNFYNGQWYDGIESKPWVKTEEEFLAILQNMADAALGEGASLDDYMMMMQGNNLADTMGFYNNSYEELLYAGLGVVPRMMPSTNAEKAAFLTDLDAGLVTASEIAALGNMHGLLFGYPTDIAFGLATLSKVWDTGGAQDLNNILSYIAPAHTGEIPPVMNLTELDFSRLNGLAGIDLTNAVMTPQQFNMLPAITGSVLGAYDMTQYNIAGKYITSSDLSKTIGLTGTMLNSTIGDLSWITIPPGTDMTGFAPTNRNINRANLTGATNLTAAMLAESSMTANTPRNVNVTGANISRADLVAAYQAKGRSLTWINNNLNTWQGLQP